MKKINKLAALITLICFSGYSSTMSEETQTTISETTTVTTAVTTSETLAAEPEVSYMEKCKDILAEMPPEEILTESEGVEYPCKCSASCGLFRRQKISRTVYPSRILGQRGLDGKGYSPYKHDADKSCC